MILNIIKHPHPILREPSQVVREIDETVNEIVINMKETMKEHGGIGLAAPQIGILKRVLVARPEDRVIIMINPIIRSYSDELVKVPEKCLSVPREQPILIKRHVHIRVEYKDLSGKRQRRSLSGLPAIVIQHEIDHLDGFTIIERGKHQEQEDG